MTLHGSEPRPHSTRRPHRYCPACGSPLVERLVEGRSLGACAACDFIAFRDPKVVAVTALVEDHAAGGRLAFDRTPAANAGLGEAPHRARFSAQREVWLLRRGIEPRVGQWALPGGYVDFDEHPSDAAARECHEEIGCEVHIERLLGVHHAAFTDGGVVIIAYLGQITGGQPQAGPEALEVARFPLGELPSLAFGTHQEILAALAHT